VGQSPRAWTPFPTNAVSTNTNKPSRSFDILDQFIFREAVPWICGEPDRWWFAPLLYAGTPVLIAALVLA